MLYGAVVDRYYVGQTSNLKDRLKRHNQGRSKYPKSGILWNLVYKEGLESRSEAKEWQNKLKTSVCRKELVRFISSNQIELQA